MDLKSKKTYCANEMLHSKSPKENSNLQMAYHVTVGFCSAYVHTDNNSWSVYILYLVE